MNAHKKTSPALDAVIRLDRLPPAGRELDVTATPEQLTALAERLGVSAVERLTARLKAVTFRGGIRIMGRLQAEVVQPCVVTFAPVHQDIDEPLDRIFLPAGTHEPETAAGGEVFVDLEGDDIPDYFDGHELDAAEMLVEILSLAVDPYPHAPGVERVETREDEDDEEASPFAGLRVLKERDE